MPAGYDRSLLDGCWGGENVWVLVMVLRMAWLIESFYIMYNRSEYICHSITLQVSVQNNNYEENPVNLPNRASQEQFCFSSSPRTNVLTLVSISSMCLSNSPSPVSTSSTLDPRTLSS